MSSEAERRELRRRKILENAESRMNKIVYSEVSSVNLPTADRLIDANLQPNKENGSFTTFDHSFDQNQDSDDLKRPPLSSLHSVSINNVFSKYRCWSAIIFGFIFRLLFNIFPDNNIFLLFLPYEIIWELMTYFCDQKRKPYPDHGLILDFLLSFGFPESLAISYGRTSEVILRIFYDFIYIFISFVILHFVLNSFF